MKAYKQKLKFNQKIENEYNNTQILDVEVFETKDYSKAIKIICENSYCRKLVKEIYCVAEKSEIL